MVRISDCAWMLRPKRFLKNGEGTLPQGLSPLIVSLLKREPGQQIEQDLHAFKQMLETGEVTKSEASIHPGMHPARPSAKAATA